jgi:hypothetical protein
VRFSRFTVRAAIITLLGGLALLVIMTVNDALIDRDFGSFARIHHEEARRRKLPRLEEETQARVRYSESVVRAVIEGRLTLLEAAAHIRQLCRVIRE